jgi:GNAT superfamily N-acetyltransferase
VPLLEIEPHEFVPGFIAAFQEVPEYCDWEQECFEQEAREVVQDFFAGRRGRPLPASRAAVISRGPDAGRVAGAAMVVALKNGDALLDVLWVVPGWQHQGLATQLLKHVQALLAEASCNTLASIWHLANQSSIAWHLKSGFVEQHDLALARLYAQAAEHELWLQRDSLTREQAQVLQAKARYYRDEADDLEKAMLNGGEASAFAIFRIERDRENPAESECGASKYPNEI